MAKTEEAEPSRASLSRESALEAEVARLRAILARAGVNPDQAQAEPMAAQGNMRSVPVKAVHAEKGNANDVEHARTEELLLQAQKMEAVGQLIGGIAHDFNNMLQGIASNLELIRRRLEQGRGEDAASCLNSASRPVERVAALANRLLAFARRQTLQPKPIDADVTAKNMTELIQRAVGPNVAVELRLGDGSWPIQCDPSQFDNALLNLAINGRDAMPYGGKLTIGTRHVRLSAAEVAHHEGAAPGEFVEVAVTDTGTGMDEATRARAFEPFFTTKPLGQGTGLGLSQLHGFVRQSGGVVQVDSALGQGTTVRFCLPRQRQEEWERDGARPEPAADDKPRRLGPIHSALGKVLGRLRTRGGSDAVIAFSDTNRAGSRP